MTLAEKITQLRKATGISQEQLAEALGVTRQSVSKWERGEAAPDIDKVVALSRFFGVSCDELLLDAPKPEESAEPKKQAPVPNGDLAWAVEQNAAIFKLKTGIGLAKAALVLAVLCCVLPYAMQAFERYLFGSFYTYTSDYLGQFPMPLLLVLTVALGAAATYFFISAKASRLPKAGQKSEQPETKEPQ